MGFPALILEQPEEPADPPPTKQKSGQQAIYDSAIPLLPATHLIGRSREFALAQQYLMYHGAGSFAALHGLPGVGKTTIATALTYDSDIRAHFSDGVLWAGLGPQPALATLFSHWGSLLGITETQRETFRDLSLWATAIRQTIGERHMLLVIDDAWKLEDALQLCVGGPYCAHLITTRFAHIATHIAGAGTIQLHELQEQEGVELLQLLAPRVVDAEPERVRALVRSVGGLPLALTLLGNYLRTQTVNKLARRITATLEQLNNSTERLQIHELHPPLEKHPGLSNGALLSLQSVIAISDQLLQPAARAALYALSIFPPKPHSFSEEAAIAVAVCTYGDLDNLSDAGIIESHGDRYMLHQVIADYARMYLHGDEEQQAIQRFIAYTTTLVSPGHDDYDLLDLESRTILAALDLAQHHAYWSQFVTITLAFVPFLIVRGLYQQANYQLLQALSLAEKQEEQTASCVQFLCYLGEVAQKRGDVALAEEYLLRGVEQARAIQATDILCDLLKHLGSIASQRGFYTQARLYLQESLQLARQLNATHRLCDILSLFGSVLAQQGIYEQAEHYLTEGLSLARQTDDRQQICALLMHRGVVYSFLGHFLRAEECFQESLFYARQLGHREWISFLLAQLGDIAWEHDDEQIAEEYFHEVLLQGREMGHSELLCTALIKLAEIARRREDYTQAQTYIAEGLTLSNQIGHPRLVAHALSTYAELHLDFALVQEAHEIFLEIDKIVPRSSKDLSALAHYGLARTLAAQGHIAEARNIGIESAKLLETIRHRKAQEVRAWVDDLL